MVADEGAESKVEARAKVCSELLTVPQVLQIVPVPSGLF